MEDQRECATCRHSAMNCGMACPPWRVNECQPSGEEWLFVNWQPVDAQDGDV